MEKHYFSAAFLAAITMAIFIATIGKSESEAMTIETPKQICFQEQVEADIDKIFIEWLKEVEENNTPYEFLALDNEYQIYLEERCAEYDLDFFLMASLMFSESSFRPNVAGDNGKSVGLFQINECNWEEMSEYGLDVFEPMDNIECGLIIFSKLMDKYEDEATAIQMYKCGEARGKQLLSEGKMLGCIEGIIDRAEKWKEKANGRTED